MSESLPESKRWPGQTGESHDRHPQPVVEKTLVRKGESLDGLIVQRFLLTHRNGASQVPFSYFCSTPESGGQVAKLGHIFSVVPLLKEMCSGNNND
jgi:hypothetical protein